MQASAIVAGETLKASKYAKAETAEATVITKLIATSAAGATGPSKTIQPQPPVLLATQDLKHVLQTQLIPMLMNPVKTAPVILSSGLAPGPGGVDYKDKKEEEVHKGEDNEVARRREIFYFTPVAKYNTISRSYPFTTMSSAAHVAHTSSKQHHMNEMRILCITTLPRNGRHGEDHHKQSQLQPLLHYLKYENYRVELKRTWKLADLTQIRRDVDTEELTFLQFTFKGVQEDSYQWMFPSIESSVETLWGILSLHLLTKQDRHGPKLVGLSMEEVTEQAGKLNLSRKFNTETKIEQRFLFDASEKLVEKQPPNVTDSQLKTDHNQLKHMIDDAAEVLHSLDWSNQQTDSTVQLIHSQIRNLEPLNLSFLLNLSNSAESAGTAPLTDFVVPLATLRTNVDVLADAIASLHLQLTAIHSRMNDIQDLNGRLENQAYNWKVLERTITDLIKNVELPVKSIQTLISPFNSHWKAINSIQEDDINHDQSEPVLTAIKDLLSALASTTEFPCNKMDAMTAKQQELNEISAIFCDTVLQYFEQSLANVSSSFSDDGGSSAQRFGGNPEVDDDEFLGRLEKAEISPRFFNRTTRAPKRNISSKATPKDDEPRDSNQIYGHLLRLNRRVHSFVGRLRPILQAIYPLRPQLIASAREVYLLARAPQYIQHIKDIFLLLKNEIPRNTFPSKLSALPLTISECQLEAKLMESDASLRLHRALEQIEMLCISEQDLLITTFGFISKTDYSSSTNTVDSELNVEPIMERLLLKLQKHLFDYADCAMSQNSFQILPMIGVVNDRIAKLERKSEYLSNVFMGFQLHLKRVFTKYIDYQMTWLSSMQPETKRAGILAPAQKFMTFLGLLSISNNETIEDTISSICHRVIPSFFAWLERVADSRHKYSDIVKLENYHYFYENSKQLQGACFQNYNQQSLKSFQHFLSSYTQWLYYSQFQKLDKLIQDIEELLLTISESEIQFHFSKQQLELALESDGSTIEKSMQQVFLRMKKHLTASKSVLFMASKKLSEFCSFQFKRYNHITLKCYGIQAVHNLDLALQNDVSL